MKQVNMLVVGSGAGGATTALELAAGGHEVLVLEEGRRYPADVSASLDPGSTETVKGFYRDRGMTPIVGSVPLAFVEGCCLGGSTEINSGFWHRLPPEMALRWAAQYKIEDFNLRDLDRHFDWAEELLHVAVQAPPLPQSTTLLADGCDVMGWSAQQVPRIGAGLSGPGERKGSRQGMSLSLIPRAEAAGATVLTNCRALLLLKSGRRATGILAEQRHEDGGTSLVRIDADNIFVCAGPIQTPALLRRSGIKYRVGETLRVHPMLKVVALFPDEVNAQNDPLPLMQVKEFWPDTSLGGAFFTSAHASIILSENWPSWRQYMPQYRRMAAYYVGVRGTGKGSVRPSMFGKGRPTVQYELTNLDLRHLSQGLARLAALLLAAGALEVFPSVWGVQSIKTSADAVRWLDEMLPRQSLNLSTVHAFSSCPMGEEVNKCAVDSFGRVNGFDNLMINDASMLPDSPGINPQGTVMAVARRNILRFMEGLK